MTVFNVDAAFVARYDVQVAGSGKMHRELWVPADELAAFDTHIDGRIRVASSFYGERFEGEIDEATGLPASVS